MKAELDVRSLTVTYGAVTAVSEVTLSVRPGRITGLIGANGAGKTSLIDAVTGFTAVASGDVLLAGESIAAWSANKRATGGLRRTFQNLRLFDDLTVRENLSVALPGQRGNLGFRSLFRPRDADAEIDDVVQLVGLSDVLDELPRNLPAGTRRLVDLGRALVARPDVLLLDEPAAGLDTVETQELGHLLLGLREDGLGMLLVEHDTSMVFSLSDDVVAIDFGRTIAAGPASAVRNDPAVLSAYLGSPTAAGEA